MESAYLCYKCGQVAGHSKECEYYRYSKEEVIELIKKAFIAGGKDYVNGTFDGPDNFIKENL